MGIPRVGGQFLSAWKAIYSAVSVVVISSLLVGIMPALPAQAAGEAISGGTNTSGSIEVYIPITGVHVTGAGGSVVPITLEVDEGELSMATTTGLTFTSDETGTLLKFEGTVTNVNAALATLRYRNAQDMTVTFRAQITGAGEVYYPGNGHVYEIVSAADLTANQARTAAAGRTKYGATGYLATITTQAENDYVAPRLSGDGWFGASDADNEGDWEWAVGPEANTIFWSGLDAESGGVPVGGRYSNWADNEPNDAGNEDCAQFYSNGSGWNDLNCGTATLDYYVVEYGAPGNMPAVTSTTFTITTTVPSAQTDTVASCTDLITAGDAANRRDTIKLTQDIDCTGQTPTPLFDDDDDFATLPFTGTFDGQGHKITGFSLNDPGRGNYGLIAYADGAAIRNVTLEGSSIVGSTCVGGIVGTANDTSIENVHVNVDVQADDEKAGGVVGCLNAIGDAAGVTDSTVVSDVDSTGDFGGGIIGVLNVDYGNTATVTDNTFTGQIADSSDDSFGGIAGAIWASDSATVTVSGNTASGIAVPSGNAVGGIVGHIRSLIASDVNLSENSVSGTVHGDNLTGGIVGWGQLYDDSSIAISSTHIDAAAVQGTNATGGFVGGLDANGNADTQFIIVSSTFKGTVSGDSTDVGGLVGYALADNASELISISGSGVEADVSTDDDNAGGLVGGAERINIYRTYSKGSVTAGGLNAGGLVGQVNGTSSIDQSYSTMVVSAGEAAGGVAGYAGSATDVTKSFALGDVEAEARVGGLVGDMQGLVENAYARGSVTGDSQVGGLTGHCEGDIHKAYATGAVTGNTATGGLVGDDDNGGCGLLDATWDTQTSGQSTSAVGTGSSTTNMKAQATYAGMTNPWDFTTTWLIKRAINDGYPCLQWYENCGLIDADGDGVADTVEAAAPNGGDANNDGIADNTQDYVASFPGSGSGAYTTTQLPAQCFFNAVSSETEQSQPVRDAGFDYSAGLIDFAADCGTNGYTAAVKLIQFGTASDGLVLRKFKPSNNAYFMVPGAMLANTTIGGMQAATAAYAITDGGSLDDDGAANGTIVDPVGLARNVLGAPNTGLQRTAW